MLFLSRGRGVEEFMRQMVKFTIFSTSVAPFLNTGTISYPNNIVIYVILFGSKA